MSHSTHTSHYVRRGVIYCKSYIREVSNSITFKGDDDANRSRKQLQVRERSIIEHRGVNALQILRVLPVPFPFPLPSFPSFSLPLRPLIQLGSLGSGALYVPVPQRVRILERFEVKVKHFRLLISCIV